MTEEKSFKEQVLEKYPNAKCVENRWGWDIILNDGEEYFANSVYSEDKAWEYALFFINNLNRIR